MKAKNQNYLLEEQILLQEKLKDSTTVGVEPHSIYSDVTFEFQYPAPVFDPNAEDELATNNIYFMWWRYLRFNKDYSAYYKDGVVPSKVQKKIFDDFGNIYGTTFRDWWETNHKGMKLFFGMSIKDRIALAPSYDLVDQRDFDRGIIYLRIPLHSHSKRELQQWFNKFLKRFHKGKRGQHWKRTPVGVYLVYGRPKLEKLKLYLDVYEYYESHSGRPLWRIAQDLKLFHLNQYMVSKPDTDARNIMSATVSRHLKKAEALIYNVGYGRFPDYKVRQE